MKVKTFHALTMQDALRAIKEELGPEAIILSSKEVREGGRLLRAFNRPVLEVMAASDQDVPQTSRIGGLAQQSDGQGNPSSAKALSPNPVNTFQQTLRGLLGPNQEPVASRGETRETSLKPAMAAAKQNRLRHWRTACDELSRLLQDLSRDEGQSTANRSVTHLAPLRRSLLEQGMNPSTIEMLLHEVLKITAVADVPADRSVTGVLQQEIARRVCTTGPVPYGDGRPAVGLLIGPSGAGKTSAVAKLAAYYRLEHRKSVAIITFDTYRETAVEQLRRFAKIVGVPFACALSARQVQEGLRRHAQMDLVLIDMPGVGPDALVLARDLRRLLKNDTMTTHLVLPASIREQEACRITRRLADLPKLCLFFTKLDEAECVGTIFEVMHATGVPLSYWSTGRRVPGDIEVVSPEHLAARLGTLGPVEGQERIGHWKQSADALSALTEMGIHHG